jgi:hypothetical protein
MRRASKVDANHATIVAAFKALGCTVQSLAAVGKGVPDLLVAFAGLNHLVECKDGSKPKSSRKQTPAQVAWASTWRAPRHLVESVEDVQRLVKAWRQPELVLEVCRCRSEYETCEVCMSGERERLVPKRGLAALFGAIPMPSDVECDASDYERPEVVEPSNLRKAGL